MEMLKKGDAPDLKPLIPKGDVPNQVPRPVATPPPPKATEGTVPQVSTPQPPVPAPQPQVFTPPAPPTVPKPDISPIETYASDFRAQVEKTGASTVTVLAAEQDAGATPASPAAPASRGNIISIVAGVALLLVGGAGAYIAYTQYLVKTGPVMISPVLATPIFVDEREKISGETPAQLLLAITQSLSHPPAPNAVRLLYTDVSTAGSTTSPQATGRSIFSALQFSAPNLLLRNVNAQGSMAGVITVGTEAAPFFILSVASYSDTFAGMLSWESKMPGDLAALYPPYPPSVVATSTATSTSSSPPSFSILFHDEVVSNHDARVYRDSEGRTVLLYGYWDQNTLVIARGEGAFTEILARLATSRSQ